MNTGLQDVWNLVWKLDLVLHGRADEVLLESYGAERRPVIQHVIATTDLLMKVLATPHRLAQALRDTVIPVVSRLTPFQHAFVQRLSGLGIAYSGSPIVEGGGKRYFSDSLRGGAGIQSRFLLVLGRHEEPAAMAAARELARSFAGLVELRSGAGRGVTLVRPDGYVAFSARDHDPGTALERVRSLLERQAHPAVASRA